MTFKDLRRLIQSEGPTRTDYSELQGKPFWIWDQKEHRQEDIKTKGLCCFNHIICLPKKDGRDMPLPPYQRTLYDSLQEPKHICLVGESPR